MYPDMHDIRHSDEIIAKFAGVMAKNGSLSYEENLSDVFNAPSKFYRSEATEGVIRWAQWFNS